MLYLFCRAGYRACTQLCFPTVTMLPVGQLAFIAASQAMSLVGLPGNYNVQLTKAGFFDVQVCCYESGSYCG